MFRYRLAVLTHGRDGTARDAVASFCAMADPLPVDVMIHADGSDALGQAREAQWFASGLGVADGSDGPPVALTHSGDREGFCRSTSFLWRCAAWGVTDAASPTHVFWLEHDFRLTRPVNVEALARVMAGRAFGGPDIAQMALMRGAANDDERRAGGLFESRRSDYTPMGVWLRHRAYFTTNPSLMHLSFMRDHPWPTYTRECEGRFGIDLTRDTDLCFGVWGDGEPWCEHVGRRTGHGY